MVDLDLDVCRTRAGGNVLVVDEDAVHHARHSYPAEVVARATASARLLRAALSSDVDPFASDYRSWLAKAACLGDHEHDDRGSPH